MKRILILSSILVGSAFLGRAQTLSPTVIASAGDYYASSWGSLSWTAGEPVVETFTAGSNILTQGFQQPENLYVTVIEQKHNAPNVSVYPNPAYNLLNLHFGTPVSGAVKLELYDVAGNVVQSYSYNAQKENGFSMDLTTLADGMYLLKITNAAYPAAQLIKIQKSN